MRSSRNRVRSTCWKYFAENSKMKAFFLIIITLLFCDKINGEKISARIRRQQIDSYDPKAFSIFSVIRFPNNNCIPVSDSTMSGTCLTAEECDDAGGDVDGNCASGFGVCCVIYESTCGTADVTRNCTYITNPSYPSSYVETSQTCNFNIKTDNLKTKNRDEICQIRLDFARFLLEQPVTTTAANQGDSMTVTSPTGRSPPVLYGNANNMHMYVETGMESNAATISIVTGTTSFSRQWKIKVSYIECFSRARAPTDCVQYFTGTSGMVQSYNWEAATTQLRGMAYHNCFRQELGYCSVDFFITNDGTSPDYYDLNGGNQNAKRTGGSCAPARIEITVDIDYESPGEATDGFCGGAFAADGGTAAPAVLRTSTTPFSLGYFTGATATLDSAEGFNINWRMVPCGSN